MATWREYVDETTEAEIDLLVRAAVGAMSRRLDSHEDVRSCMVARTATGRVEVCEDKADDPDNALAARVFAHPDEYRAVAYLVDIRNEGEVHIGVEHSDGVAITVCGPYRDDAISGNRYFGSFYSEPAAPTIYRKPLALAPALAA